MTTDPPANAVFCRPTWALTIAAAVLCGLYGCAAPSPGAPPPVSTAPSTAQSSAPPAAPATPPPVAADMPREIRTANGTFRSSKFDELPGWRTDDLSSGWAAFQESCRILDKRAHWNELCAKSRNVAARDNIAVRQFFEREFSLLSLVNTDASREGDVTGYYEPLLAGSPVQQGKFTVPVYGVPNDLYTLDWKLVPQAQRKSVVYVRPVRRVLTIVAASSAGAYAMDLSSFGSDVLDRRLRVRLGNGQALPYYSREQIQAQARLDAPVLAWVDDPVALYAMQVQGSGRVRLPDGNVLRVHYAEQNGHPFRPLRVAAKSVDRVVTRGGDSARPESLQDEPEQFELLTTDDSADAGPPVETEVVTRGARGTAKAGGARSANKQATDALVQQLMRPPAAGTRASAPARAPSALQSDPSYVFFRVAADQKPGTGPVGALGVPLTAGRSIAVDPRATPLGYPIYLSAAGRSAADTLQRLVFAQDTGGAIRGAVRADYFWGFGTEAGRLAQRTRHRGRMWLFMPAAEAARALQPQRIVTRGAATPAAEPDRECLVEDDTYCAGP